MLQSVAKQRELKPKFEVHELEGEREHTIHKYTGAKNKLGKIKNTMTAETVKEPAGHMVYFPNGNSIRVRNDSELRRLSLLGDASLVDMDTGEEVQVPHVVSLKENSERKTHPTKQT